MKLNSKIFLFNSSTGSRFQPVGFLVPYNGYSKKVTALWREPNIPSNGFGSYMCAIDGWSLKKVFIAVYYFEKEWFCMIDQVVYRFDQIQQCTWQKKPFSFLGIGLVNFEVMQKGGKNQVITYFRPWLRHWSESMWTVDDIDIGATVAHIYGDPEARDRILKEINKK